MRPTLFLYRCCSLSLLLLSFSIHAVDDMNPTGNPVGGGIGYSNHVDLAAAKQVIKVSSVEQLVLAMAEAGNGDVVYVNDSVELDLSGVILSISSGVTLASGRGLNGSQGALLYSDELRTLPLIKVTGDNVRITGLRLRGPDPERRTEQMTALLKEGKFYTISNSRGITSTYASLEVDNCELFGWSHAAIRLRGANQAHIHHNFIHHNQRHGLGYGVVLSDANAVIEANIFDWNRHSIAGNGEPNTSYEARYNIVLENTNSHAFDMHGGSDRKDGTVIAGDEIKIHHNVFYPIREDIDAYGVIAIRGIPRIGAFIYNNDFKNATSLKVAVRQKNAIGMMRVNDNLLDSCN